MKERLIKFFMKEYEGIQREEIEELVEEILKVIIKWEMVVK